MSIQHGSRYAGRHDAPTVPNRWPLGPLVGLVLLVASATPAQAQVGSLPPELRQEWEKRQRERLNPPSTFTPLPPFVPARPNFDWSLPRPTPRTEPPVVVVPDGSPLSARKPTHMRTIGAPFPCEIWSAAFRPDNEGLAVMTPGLVYVGKPIVYYWDFDSRIPRPIPFSSVPNALLRALYDQEWPQGQHRETVRIVTGGSTPNVVNNDTISVSHDGERRVEWTRGKKSLCMNYKNGSAFQDWDTGNSQGIHALVFSPDDHRIASASHPEDYTTTEIKVRDAETGRLISEWAIPLGHRGYPVPRFSPDGSELAVAFRGEIELWDVTTARKTGSLLDPELRPTGNGSWVLGQRGPNPDITNFRYSADGRRLVIHTLDGFQVWDTRTRTITASHDCFSAPIVAVAYDPTGSRLFATSYSGTTEWDPATGLRAGPPQARTDGSAQAVAFSADGRLIARGDRYGLVHLWEAESGRLCATLEGHNGGVLSLASTPDGTALASGGEDGTIQIWSLTDSATSGGRDGAGPHEGSASSVLTNAIPWIAGGLATVALAGAAYWWHRVRRRGVPQGTF